MRALSIIPIAKRMSPLIWLAACAVFVVVMAWLVTALLNYRAVITPVEPAPSVWKKLETALELPLVGSASDELRVVVFSVGWTNRTQAYVITPKRSFSVDLADAADYTRFLSASFSRRLPQAKTDKALGLLSGLEALQHDTFGCEMFDAARYEIEGSYGGRRFSFEYDGCSDHPVPAIDELIATLGD